MRDANDAHVSKVTHHPHPAKNTTLGLPQLRHHFVLSDRLKHGHTHTHTPQSARTPFDRHSHAAALLLFLLRPPTGHDPRHLFVLAPTVRSLGNGPHLMTSGMPRAVVAVSSVIPLFFGLMSRNYNPREILTCSQLADLA